MGEVWCRRGVGGRSVRVVWGWKGWEDRGARGGCEGSGEGRSV